MIVVIMGVSASGETTIGQALASRLGGRFVDADDLHPPANVAKMARSEPLTDSDRAPWLAAVRAVIDASLAADEKLVVACSALKREYREVLGVGRQDVALVLLDVPPDVLAERLAKRKGHFAGPGLLASQLTTLEAPSSGEALVVDASAPPDRVVDEIVTRLPMRPSEGT
jgi:gluconokinase